MTLHKSTADNAAQCPLRDVLDRITDRWSLIILRQLAVGQVVRFISLKTAIGDISQRMLAKTLQRLEEDGLVKRTVFPTVPLRVDYQLTPLGSSFLELVNSMVAWAEVHHDAIRSARHTYANLHPRGGGAEKGKGAGKEK